jgi:hypothetical protein
MKRTDFPSPDDCSDVKIDVQPRILQQINENVDKLSDKERAALGALLADPLGKSKQRACREAGYAETKTSRTTAVFKRIETKLGIALSEFWEIGMHEAALIIASAMRATKQIVTHRKIYSKDGKLRRIEPVIHEVPDHNMRLKALKMVMSSKPAGSNDNGEPNPFEALSERNRIASDYEVSRAS